jgi:hypothetical protein
MRRRTLSLLVVSLLVAGCSDDAATPATTGTPAVTSSTAAAVGTEPFVGEGFTMLVPSDWTVVSGDDFRSGELQELIAEGLAETVESEAFADQIGALFAQGVRMFAFDFRNAAPEFVDNVNVIVLPRSPLDAAGLISVGVQQLETYLGATIVSTEVQQLPGGEAVVIRYLQGTAPVLEQVGVTVITATQEWTITLSAIDADRHEAIFTTMLDSFREAG